MFLGTYFYNLDTKGRIVVPAKLRSDLEERVLYVSKGLDSCLEVRTPEQFKKWFYKLNNVNQALTNERALRRKIMAFSEAQPLDRVGRMKVSTALLNLVGVKREVAIIGNGEWFEIWSRANWDEFIARNENVEGQSCRSSAINAELDFSKEKTT